MFRTAINIVHRLRNRTGLPRYFVWENVPGAFSSNKGFDFKAVLEEIGQSKIPMPPNGKWANAGLVELPRCEIAWRVIDAQYWGVPQRRRRIFLIADFATSGRCAGEILFESEGLLGNTSESGGAGQSTPSDSERSTGEASGCDVYNGALTGDKACSLTAGYSVNSSGPKVVEKTVYSFDAKSSNSMKSSNPHSGCHVTDVAKTLDTTVPTPEKNQGGIAIHEEKTYSLQGSMIGRKLENGPQGDGINEDISFTLNATDRHAVCPSKD